jgi:hypothetical protein
MDGFLTHTEDIEVRTGINSPVQVALQEFGRLFVESPERGARVSANGQNLGTTPLNQRIAPGRYSIEVSADNFSTYRTSITVQPGDSSSVRAELEPLMATAKILVNPFGAIYVDGTLVRDEDSGWYESPLIRGTHEIRVTHPGFGAWVKRIAFQNELQEVRINFLKEMRVKVTSGFIGGAMIYIDGASTGFETPSEDTVRLGNTTLEVRTEG